MTQTLNTSFSMNIEMTEKTTTEKHLKQTMHRKARTKQHCYSPIVVNSLPTIITT